MHAQANPVTVFLARKSSVIAAGIAMTELFRALPARMFSFWYTQDKSPWHFLVGFH